MNTACCLASPGITQAHPPHATALTLTSTPGPDPQIADEFGIPVHKQRYWTWAKRANGTHRIKMPLSEEHESREVMDLREFREQGASHTAKHALMDLKLFLESPAPNPDKDLVQVS